MIKEFIEEAELNWREGKKKMALVHVLLAIAATGRKRYPKDSERGMEDSDSFKYFIKDISGIIETGISSTPGPLIIFGLNPSQDIPRELEGAFYSTDKKSREIRTKKRNKIKKEYPNILSLGDIFYECRNSLFHEASLPKFIDSFGDAFVFNPETNSYQLPNRWILNAIQAIKKSPENQDLFNY